MRSLRMGLVCAAAVPVMLGVLPARSGAVSTETWRVSGRDGFMGADLESLAISSDGIVMLAPAF